MKNQYFVWGQNNFGQLGTGSNASKNIFEATEAFEGKIWRSLSIGHNFSVGVLNDGTLWAWGSNACGIFGKKYKLTDFFLEPICLSSETTWDQVACGKKHVLALKFLPSGKRDVWGWGFNSNYQLGLETNETYIFEPNKLLHQLNNFSWNAIACGTNHSLILREDGAIFSAGNNSNGQCGIYSEPVYSKTFQRITSKNKFNKISCGDNFSVALDTEGKLWSWGNNTLGQLGIGNTNYTTTINNVSTTETNILDVSCGHNFTIFSTINGLFGFGDNTNRLLSDSDDKIVSTPGFLNFSKLDKIETGDSILWKKISCGASHFAVIKQNLSTNKNHLFIAGSNENGQLGVSSNFSKRNKKNYVKNSISETWLDVICGSNCTFCYTYPIPVTIISSSDTDVNLNEEEAINLSIEANGTKPLHYEWLYDDGESGFKSLGENYNSNILTVSKEGKYQCKVSNFSGKVYSEIFYVKKYAAPSIIHFSPTEQNLKINTHTESNKKNLMQLTVSCTSLADSLTKTTNNPTTDFYYNWYYNNVPIHSTPVHKKGRLIPGFDNLCKSSDTLYLGKDFKPGVYFCEISNKYGISKTQNWFISSIEQTKLLTDFPEDLLITTLDPLPTLIAEIKSEDEPSFQWFIDNELDNKIPLEGENLNFLKLEKPGAYTLKIFNQDYEIFSKKVKFSILDAFEITSQPKSYISLSEKNVKESETSLVIKTKGFIINNNKIENPIFQWYKEDIAIPNENNPTLHLSSLGEPEGVYHCRILNANVKSNKFKVKIFRGPSILNQTKKIDFISNKKNLNKLQIDFKGDLPLKLTWFSHLNDSSKKVLKKITLDEENTFSQTFSDFIFIENEGTYSCLIENRTDQVWSEQIIASNYIPAQIENYKIIDCSNDCAFISLNKFSLATSLQNKAILEVETKGSGEINYKWQIKHKKIWIDLPEKTNSLKIDKEGIYRCRVNNLLKAKNTEKTDQIFLIAASAAPIIIAQPKSKFVIEKNSNITLFVDVEDAGEIETHYQWFYNEEPIEDSDAYDFIASEQGAYYCRITNSFGYTDSNVFYVLHREDHNKEIFNKKLLIQKHKGFKTSGDILFKNIVNKHATFLTKPIGCDSAEGRSFYISEDKVLYGCGKNDNNELGVKITVENATANLNLVSNNVHSYYIRKLFNDLSHKNLNKSKFATENLDNSTNLSENINVFLPILANVNTIKSGLKHTLAIIDNPSQLENQPNKIIVGSGSNDYFQLGDFANANFVTNDLLLPSSNTWKTLIIDSSILPSNNPIQIACGAYHSLVLYEDGSLYSVGLNNNLQTGVPFADTEEDTSVHNWVKIASDAIFIAAYNNNSYYINNDNILYGCGSNTYKQIVIEDENDPYAPGNLYLPLTEMVTDAIKCFAGNGTIFYLNSNQELFGKGQNQFNQLGLPYYQENDTLQMSFAFIRNDITKISAGEYHTLGLTEDGIAYAVGNNNSGQLGDGTGVNALEWREVGSSIIDIAAGPKNSILIKNLSQNQNNQLNDKKFKGLEPSEDISVLAVTGSNEYNQSGLEDTNSNISDLSQSNTSVKELYSTINMWSVSNKTNFVNNLRLNNFVEFEIIKDACYILTTSGFLFEKIKYDKTNDLLSPISKFSEIVPIAPNNLNEAYPSYWYDGDNFVYTANINNISQIKENSFAFELKIHKFDIEKGLLVLILDEIIYIDYTHKIFWDDFDYLIHRPVLNYCESTKNLNVSFSLADNTYEFGLISINLVEKFFIDKAYLKIDNINAYLPWFTITNVSHQAFIKPAIRLYLSQVPNLLQNLIIYSELLNEATDVSYQWFKDGEKIIGETNQNLILESLSLSDLGIYELRATNLAGTSYEKIWIQL